MKSFKKILFMVTFLVLGFTFVPAKPAYAACNSARDTLGIPHWYKYLKEDEPLTRETGKCVALFEGVGDVVLVVFAIIEICIRIATYLGIVFFIYGAIQITMSQGSPENVNKGRQTIINALVGVAIALIATAVVNFIGVKLG